MSPEQFHANALSAADADGRLPVSRLMPYWDIFPFEPDSLRVVPLRAAEFPEQDRMGEDPASCNTCTKRDEGVWLDDHWRLTVLEGVGVPLLLMLFPRDHHDLPDLPDEMAAELGRLSVHIARAVEALPHIARAHVYRIGDGGAHLHVFFFARPAGFHQMRGSGLVLWDDLLPEYPHDLAEADGFVVAESLAASYGGTVNR
jgi:diadenosine tetraphosphate (Ap4A) HIT family hydrolase